MRFIYSILVILFVFSQTNISLAQDEINLLNNKYLWSPIKSNNKIKLTDAGLIFSSEASLGGIYNQRPVNTSIEKYNLLAINIKASRDNRVELFWAAQRKLFSHSKNYPFYLKAPGNFHSYYINLAAYNRDRSKIDYLLFAFSSAPGRVEIKEIKLIRGTLWQKMIAGWQEFFGPLGREPDGFNFLVIRSPRLFGLPFLAYINWWLGLFLAAVILLRSRLDLRWPFLLIIFFLWIFLESSSLLNHWISFQRDRPFFGKSLEEKRELLNNKDFYPFLKFADREIPAGAPFDVLFAGMFNQDRAIYYLYPRPYLNNAPYLLVFDRRIGKDSLKKYKIWKRFRKGAYILKIKNNVNI